MKTLIFLFITALAAHAQGPEPLPNVVVDIQMISLPRAKAMPLMRDLLSPETAAAAGEKVQALVEKNEAELLGWPMVITKSGQRAQIEGVREIRYPTEFDPGQVHISVEMKGIEVEKVVPEIPGVYLSPVAAQFETRNTGITLEVEPVLSPDWKSIDLNLVPQHVRLRGMTQTELHPKSDKHSERITVEQPEFETLRSQTSLTLKNGGRILLAAFPLAEDRMELFILHAETRQP